ncbi:MAG: hypothetical protein R3B99_33140 [Polyangiales bacterium]
MPKGVRLAMIVGVVLVCATVVAYAVFRVVAIPVAPYAAAPRSS